jgi:type IV secretion system protein VirB3
MASTLKRETVFIALTRPQMFAGVTYSFFVVNMIISAELFLLFKSLWAIAFAIVLHLTGALLCLREPRIFDLWIARVSLCPRIRNYALWGCNSYRP